MTFSNGGKEKGGEGGEFLFFGELIKKERVGKRLGKKTAAT